MDGEMRVGAVRTTDHVFFGPGCQQHVTVFDPESMMLTYEVGNGLPPPIKVCVWVCESMSV